MGESCAGAELRVVRMGWGLLAGSSPGGQRPHSPGFRSEGLGFR